MKEKSNTIDTEKKSIGDKAPNIDTIDVYNNPVKMERILKTHEGILIDFYRGIW